VKWNGETTLVLAPTEFNDKRPSRDHHHRRNSWTGSRDHGVSVPLARRWQSTGGRCFHLRRAPGCTDGRRPHGYNRLVAPGATGSGDLAARLSALETEVNDAEAELTRLRRQLRVTSVEAEAARDPAQFEARPPWNRESKDPTASVVVYLFVGLCAGAFLALAFLQAVPRQ
jgi:hypothetical protein